MKGDISLGKTAKVSLHIINTTLKAPRNLAITGFNIALL